MIELSAKRPVSVLVVCIGIFLLGFISYQRIPIQLMPEMNIPEFKIITSWGNATAEEVENQITIPLERAFSTVSGLRSTTSTSEKGNSEIKLRFKSGIDIPQVVSEIRDRIDSSSFPEGTKRPRLNRFQSQNQIVSEYLFKSVVPLKSLMRLNEELSQGLKQELEKIEGVALIQIIGAPEKTISIQVNPVALQTAGLSLQGIVDAIQSRNKSVQAGQVQYLGQSIPVKIGKPIEDLNELRSITLKKEGLKSLRLADVAKVELLDQTSTRVRLDSQPSLLFQISKEAEANSVEVAAKIRTAISEFTLQTKDEISVVNLADQGKEIELAVDNVKGSVISGAILAALIIYLLLQSAWTSFVITIAIPISLMITLILMYFSGVTFNLMSLAGLALGVGMLVDNSTIVLESIFEQALITKSKMESAIQGTKNVASAITASTLSTIAVFAPLVFIEGEIGFLFKDVALTVCFSIFASLMVALIVIPCLSTREFNQAPPDANSPKPEVDLQIADHDPWYQLMLKAFVYNLRNSASVFALIKTISLPNSKVLDLIFNRLKTIHDGTLNLVQVLFSKFENLLDRLIPYWVERLGKASALIVGTVLIGALIINSLGSELFPEEKVNKLQVLTIFPSAQLDSVNRLRMTEVEEKLSTVSGVTHIATQGTPGKPARYLVSITTEQGKLEQVTDEALRILSKIPDLIYDRKKMSVFGAEKPVQIIIANDQIAKLKTQTDLAFNSIKELTGISDVESSLAMWSRQVQVEVENTKLAAMGLDASPFIVAAQNLLSFRPVPPLNFGAEVLQGKIQGPANYLSEIDSIGNISVEVDEGKRIYFRQISKIKNSELPAQLQRIDRSRIAEIRANLNGWDLEKASLQITSALAKADFKWKFGGQKEQQEVSNRNLAIAVALSMLLIFLITASQFESLTDPLVVLLAVPLSIIGVALFLVFFGLNFSSLVIVGFIILIGASVNTSIVMVDFANQLVIAGATPKEAIVKATKKRMRPIVVTTAANILGLIPMAFSFGQPGSSMQQPLSVTLIGGLVSSTLLTLIAVPSFYVFIKKRKTDVV